MEMGTQRKAETEVGANPLRNVTFQLIRQIRRDIKFACLHY